MTIDMQARKDAFLMLTDERPPEQLERWLVMWTARDSGYLWTEYHQFTDVREAETWRQKYVPETNAKVYDLDAQS